MEETGSKDVFVNFVLGHIGKNERPKMRNQYFQENENKAEIFFHNLEEKAKYIKLENGIVNVTYTYSNVETTREVDKKMITWNNPPLRFPVKICKIAIEEEKVFRCLTCSSNGRQHTRSCNHQINDDLVVNKDWVRKHLNQIKKSLGGNKKNISIIEKYLNSDYYLTYENFTKRVIRKKQISYFQRVSVTQEINNKKVIFDIYRDATIRIFRLPIEQKWEKIAKDFVIILKKQIDYPYNFIKDKSFVFNQRRNYRVLEKNNFDFNITLDLDELKKHIDKFLKKSSDSDSDSESDSDSGNLETLQDGSLRCLKYKFYVPFDKKIEEQQGNDLIDFCKVTIEIFPKGGLNLNMSVLKFNDKERKGAYTNLYFQDKLKIVLPKTPDLDIKYNEIQKIIKTMEENVYLLYIKDGQRLKNSIKHLTWDGKEPKDGKISFRPSQPYNRALEPYGFTGKPIYQGTYLDFRGIKIKDKYYPTCTPKIKTLREHICAKIVGFPRDDREARKYGFNIKNGKYVDVSSGIKKGKPGWSRVIKPYSFINEEQKNYIIDLLDKDPNCNERTLVEIFNYLKIDANRFEKCLMKYIFKLDTIDEQEKFEFPKEFPKPLTFTNLINICRKEISLHIIPVDAIISYKKKNKIYYIRDGKKFERKYKSKEKGFGFIDNKGFTPLVYTKTSNVLTKCKKELEKNKKQLVFITKDDECYYWSSKGYSELSYNCKVVPRPKDNDKLFIAIKNINNNWKQIEDEKFYQFYYPTLSALKTIEGHNNSKREKLTVSGNYNRNGQIYVGKPVKKVEQRTEVEDKEELTNELIRYKELMGKKTTSEEQKILLRTLIEKVENKLKKNDKQIIFYKEKDDYIQNKIKNLKVTNDILECFKRCINKNNFQNLLHIHYPITKDFFTKKAKYGEKIEFHKFIFPYSTQVDFTIQIQKYIDSIIPGNGITQHIDRGFIMVFYDEDGVINYYITDITQH